MPLFLLYSHLFNSHKKNGKGRKVASMAIALRRTAGRWSERVLLRVHVGAGSSDHFFQQK